ncbi:MAG: indolepyruvate ferredoxin oxidoreductase, partial [Frankiales bacterium]|nr:indolepyruvate ferredoxin oxidoreductase [Frankiales bacterium]
KAADIFLAGIGGTGIVTVNQLLGTAALRSSSSHAVIGLDQVGLSQKAGPVTSHLRVGDLGPANRVAASGADLLLGFDALVAGGDNSLAVCSAARTVAVVSTSETPTGNQVADAGAVATDTAGLLRTIRGSVKSVFEIDALGVSEHLFGTAAPANLLLVGAAFQLGLLPFPSAAIEEAIELNGVAIKANLAAFRWGRVAVAQPDVFAAATRHATGPVDVAYDLGASPLAGETRRLVEVRAKLLVRHSGRRTAGAYVGVVEQAWRAERSVTERTDYSEAVARATAQLMAYKDEYEVARLLTRPELLDTVQEQVPGATKVTYNLHPPMLRELGMGSKLKLGEWSRPGMKLLAKGKFLRGTPLDPFGQMHVRKVERALLARHLRIVEELTARLSTATYDRAVQVAAAPEVVRGYEGVKLANVARYEEAMRALLPERADLFPMPEVDA